MLTFKRDTFVPDIRRSMVNIRLTLALSIWTGRSNIHSDGGEMRPSPLLSRQGGGWQGASLPSQPAKPLPSSCASRTSHRLSRVLAHITGHGSSIDMKPIITIMMSKGSGPIRKDRASHDGPSAKSTLGRAQGSGALILEEPPCLD